MAAKKKTGKKTITRTKSAKKATARKTAGKKTATRKPATGRAVTKKTSKKKTAGKKTAPRKKVTKKTPTVKKTTKKKVTSKKKVAKKKPVASKKTTKKKVTKKKPAASKKISKKKVTKKKPVTSKKTTKKKVAKKKPLASKKITKKKVVASPASTKAVVKKQAAAKPAQKAANKNKNKDTGQNYFMELKNKQFRRTSTDVQPFMPYRQESGEEFMNAGQTEHFRQILLNWKRLLMEEVDRTVHHMQDDAANFPDPNDRATQEEEFALELRTRDRERKLIRKINEAILRLETGDFGYCEVCGVDIGIKRLEARPTATLCIDCKTLDEIKEKQLG